MRKSTSTPSRMPSDLRRPSPRRPSPSSSSFTPLRVFLVCFCGALYALVALRYDLPPYNWIDAYVNKHVHQGDKVLRQRPGMRGVERYSPEFRYRPAASPVITEVAKDGKVNLKGQYHFER
ncbi:hypothetical protein JCM6882_001647 [Rhodosporidiobolus microsporus]